MWAVAKESENHKVIGILEATRLLHQWRQWRKSSVITQLDRAGFNVTINLRFFYIISPITSGSWSDGDRGADLFY